MISFNNNESMSFIKGYHQINFRVDDTPQNGISIKNTKKNEKHSYLPDIKVNIILNDNHKYKNSDSDDSDNENKDKRNLMTFMKLPPLKQQVQDNITKVVSQNNIFYTRNRLIS